MNAVIAGGITNIVLDYVFIFILKWGMFGAALATSLGYIVGAVIILLICFILKGYCMYAE
mgnify:CR=1 FL=1